MLRPLFTTLAIGLFLSVTQPLQAGEARPQKVVRLLTGPLDYDYNRVGEALKEIAEHHDLQIQVVHSNGSADNIQGLAKGEAELAIVQSDVAHLIWRKHPLPKDWDQQLDYSKIQLVAPLYVEAVQILLQPHLYISRPSELRDKRVWIGQPLSGAEFSARAVLRAAGLSEKELDGFRERTRDIPNFPAAIGKLDTLDLDAIVQTAVAPTKRIQEALKKNSEIRLLGLDFDLVRALVANGSYSETLITKDIYPERESTLTVGVQALLLTRSDVSDDTVNMLVRILQRGRRQIEGKLENEGSARGGSPRKGTARGGPPGIRLQLLDVVLNPQLYENTHPAAQKLFPQSQWRDVETHLILSLIALFLLAYLYFHVEPVRLWLQRGGKALWMILALGFIWVFGAEILKHLEGNVNDHYSGLAVSIMSTFFYILGAAHVPVPARTPMTQNGLYAANCIAYLAGFVLLVFLLPSAKRTVGHVIQAIENWYLWRWLMSDKFRDHLVLVNWDARSEEIIKQLREPVEVKRTVVVVADEQKGFPPQEKFLGVYYLTGDPTDKECLRRAEVESAFSVIILSPGTQLDMDGQANDSSREAADMRSVLAIQSIRSVPSDARIVAEIRMHKMCEHARNAGRGGETEIVCREDFAWRFLTQCAVTPGYTKLWEKLCTFQEKNSEIYQGPVPRECVGKRFGELLQYYADLRRRRAESTIPIGVYRAPEVYLNPNDTQLGALEEGDSLFVLRDRQPSEARATAALGAGR